ncbi:MAG: hypothetical protein HYV07_29535 [Deltaproteobacteria bacterium]|nr:hypothetical protein [Deltaproteobacteria bacterium]
MTRWLLLLGLLGTFACEEARVRNRGRTTSTRDAGTLPDSGNVEADAGPSEEDAGPRPRVPEVDPSCLDGQYSETLPEAGADLSEELASYQQSSVTPFILAALEKRYPVGRAIVEGGLANTRLGDCIARFLSPSADGDEVLQQLSTIVHECGHFYDLTFSTGDRSTYVITPTLRFDCSGGSARGTFARSLLNQDGYSARRPPCGPGGGRSCDSYADIYLDGDPTDGTFDSGDQGFDMLLEETVQYVNSLASGYAFADRLPRGISISERDGILTFLWYTGRYLKLARDSHPVAYLKLSEDTCWREAILTVWGRAWLYLEATDGDPSLGIDDQALIALVRDPEILGEIQRLREAAGCL